MNETIWRNLCVGGRKILKWILKIWARRTGFIWLRIETDGVPLLTL
jgi:hypothetical protein